MREQRERRVMQAIPTWTLPVLEEDPTYPNGSRVQLHPATDRWMMGDRFGEIVGRTRSGLIRVKLDKSGLTLRFKPALLQRLR